MMLANLAIGTILVALSVVLHTGGLVLLAGVTPPIARYLGLHNHDPGRTILMAGTVLGLLSVLTLEVWMWALAYWHIGVTPSFSDALYLSIAMFSTVGYGEITFDASWRLLTGLEGISGFLMIGWSTAYLVRASTRHGPFRINEHF